MIGPTSTAPNHEAGQETPPSAISETAMTAVVTKIERAEMLPLEVLQMLRMEIGPTTRKRRVPWPLAARQANDR